MTLRTVGLIGGMSYHSTVDYYLGINDAVAHAVGGHASAPILLSSLDFQQVRDLQVVEDWPAAGRLLAHHARILQDAGAHAVLICTNLMHKVAPAVQDAIDIPLIHIADAVARAATDRGVTSLGIMGAGWTMREDFYADRLTLGGIHPVRAGADDADLTDQIVFDELTQGVVLDSSKEKLLGVVERLVGDGADGVVLGCTELPLILSDGDATVPLIDSTKAHVRAAVDFILGERD
ncbi:MAG: amino acid racemase [Propionibacteriaceae bacterium]|nr:amino acid racemase [Propionibacteriaceae bacterium]